MTKAVAVRFETYSCGQLLPAGIVFDVRDGEHIAVFRTNKGDLIDVAEGDLVLTHADGTRLLAQALAFA